MKLFRTILWVAIFVLGAFLAWSTFNWSVDGGNQPVGSGKADIGGAFAAQLSDGSAITEKDLLGRPHVMFFGFTHCPDVCPTTLYEGTLWLMKGTRWISTLSRWTLSGIHLKFWLSNTLPLNHG